MAAVNSPNMNLPIPTAGGQPGPDFAFNINQALTLVDSHDHSPGAGVQITPAGLNINASLPLNNNLLTSVKGAIFQSQTSTPGLQGLYVAPGTETPLTQDLWFTDSNGNDVQITSGGFVNATIASIPGESYAAGTFFWKQGAGSTTPANFDIGSIVLRPNAPGTTFGARLTPHASISSQYDLVLPLLPVSQSVMTLDQSGNILTPTVFPLPAAGLASDSVTTIKILDQNVTTPKLADGAVTSVKLAAPNYQLSASSGNVPINGDNAYHDVNNLSVTITAGGRPVMVIVQPDAVGAGGGYIQGTSAAVILLKFLRDATTASELELCNGTNLTTSGVQVIPAGAISFVDFPASGTYTYKLQARTTVGSSVTVKNCKLLVYEL